MLSKSYIKKHNNFFKSKVKQIKSIHPAEWLLRLIMGKWVGLDLKFDKNDRVLDYSCGYGRNLEIFRDINVKLYATEISANILRSIKNVDIFIKRNVSLSVGVNGQLKFKNDFFKLIYACNSCYYVKNISELKKSMIEFRRVLRKDGVFIFNIPTPQHSMIKNNKKNGNIATISYDKLSIRNHGSFYFSKNKRQLKNFLENYFHVDSIYHQKLDLKDYTEDYYICVCKKN